MKSLRPYLRLALAASVVLAVGLSVFVYRNIQSNSVSPTVGDLRRPNGPTNTLSLTSPANGTELNAGPADFRWMDAGNGVRYEFTLTDERGDIVAKEKLSTSSLVIDLAKLRLTAHRPYYWSVSARLPDGTSRESGVAAFTLR